MPIIRKISPFFVILLLIFISMSSAWPAVYQCEDEFGGVKFSDEPCSRGESSKRINWLKSSYTNPAKKHNTKSQAKSSRKKIKSSEPVVLVSLLTTTQLQIKTDTLTSSRGGETGEYLELLLADGIRLDLTKVNTIQIKKSTRNNEIIAHIVMSDGFENTQIIPEPYPIISGDINIGRFSKSLQDIKTMEFYNSSKLPQKYKKEKVVSQSKHQYQKQAQAQANNTNRSAKEEVPVIELDMSEKVQATTSAKPVADPKIKTSEIPYRQSAHTVAETAARPADQKPASRANQHSQNAELTLVNDRRLKLQKNTMGSQRGSAAAQNKLILSKNVQVPYKDIKQIKIRPTADKSAVVVAVHLLTGEIKMENMSRPFTLISGQSGSQNFSGSLLEIKSVRFQ